FPTAKLPTGVLDGLSSTTSTSPLTPAAAPDATRASNCVDPVVPKLTSAYSRVLPFDSCAAWFPSTPAGSLSVVVVTVTVPWLVERRWGGMWAVGVVVEDLPPPPPPVPLPAVV